MKYRILIVIALTSIMFGSCKKEYVCECSTSGGKFNAFTIKDTKLNAKRKCKDYYDTNHGSVAANETFCEIK